MPQPSHSFSTPGSNHELGVHRAIVLDGLLGRAEALSVQAAALFLDETNELHPTRDASGKRLEGSRRGDRGLWLEPGCIDLALERLFDLVEASTAVVGESGFYVPEALHIQLAVYDAGSGDGRLYDSVRSGGHGRVLSIYFADDWRPGDGGELALYDDTGCCTRLIEPVADRLVVFPVRTPHAVLAGARGPRTMFAAFGHR